MIVPSFWAEAKVKDKIDGHQITIKRFGWSDTSEQDAQNNAQLRAEEALDRARSGENVRRIDFKVSYNGEDGLPIREEIIARHGETIITRNSYGALCLNTPDILFADIDFDTKPHFNLSLIVFSILLAISGIASILSNSGFTFIGLCFLSMIFANSIAESFLKAKMKMEGGFEERVKNAIRQYVNKNPDSHFRLYRTPMGCRVLAMHTTFDPATEEPFEILKAWDSDRIYIQMCKNQKCFRARVSPKPWRIGVDRLTPRPGIWPIKLERMPDREKWVKQYSIEAKKIASCEFVEEIGSNIIDPKAEAVRVLHDKYSKSETNLPIA